MCIYTVKKQKFKKNLNPQGGCATPPNVPKLGVSGVKDTAKTNQDLGMSCFIQVEYSVFSAGSPLLTMSKKFSKIFKKLKIIKI